jgi:hypothetical protein
MKPLEDDPVPERATRPTLAARRLDISSSWTYPMNLSAGGVTGSLLTAA